MTTDTSDTVAPTATVHRFERAGLGKAPFRYLRTEVREGPVKGMLNGVEVEIGAPGQPMGTCDFCAMGIKECCVIRSADGKEFIVGNECVKKTGDKGLVRAAKDAHNEHAKGLRDARKAKQAEKDHARIDAAREALNRQDVRDALAAKPHPRGFTDRKTGSALTLLDWAEWMMANAGTSGRLDVAKAVETVEAGTHAEVPRG